MYEASHSSRLGANYLMYRPRSGKQYEVLCLKIREDNTVLRGCITPTSQSYPDTRGGDQGGCLQATRQVTLSLGTTEQTI